MPFCGITIMRSQAVGFFFFFFFFSFFFWGFFGLVLFGWFLCTTWILRSELAVRKSDDKAL